MSYDARIEALRSREEAGESLTEGEHAELLAFYRIVEQQENTYLPSATGRLREQRLLLEETSAQLEALVRKKRHFLEQMRRLATEIAELDKQEDRLLATSRI